MIKFSIATRMTIIFAVIAITQAGITAIGLRGLRLSDQDIAEVYEARLVPVSKLSRINDLMNRGLERLIIAVIARPSPANLDPYIRRTGQALTEIGAWTEQHAGPAGRGQDLLDRWASKREALISKAIKPGIAALQKQNFNEAEDILLGEGVKQFAAVQEAFDAVIANELARARHTHEQAAARYSFARYLALGAVALALGLSGLLALYVKRAITGPLAGISRALTALAHGNKLVDIPHIERADEVGETAKAAQSFKESLLRIEAMEVSGRKAEARAEGQRKADMRALAGVFETAMGEIAGSVSVASGELEASASVLTRVAEAGHKLSEGAATASDEASGNVHSVAAAAEELSASIAEISRQALESRKIASEAVRQAEKTDARIADLSQAARCIGDVVGLIKTISERTNLLALNAAIEAARSGKAGRGFAVVASQVKALAMQTGKATEDIRAQIASVQAATKESVMAIKEIGSTVARVSEIAGVIAGAVEEQSAAMQEIARNVNRAAHVTSEVAVNMNDVRHAASETGAVSSQVLASAKSLSAGGRKLKSELDEFLSKVRAA